jgi:hypothetical protein
MRKLDHVRGYSSLFFMFSAVYACIKSDDNFVYWKIFNIFLPPISYLCNASHYFPLFLTMDYSVITALSLSYILERRIISTILLFGLIEVFWKNQIVITKNVADFVAVGKAIWISYVFKTSKIHFLVLVSSACGFGITYYVRSIFFVGTKTSVNLNITRLMHFCVMSLLCCISTVATKEYIF